jgi:predicted nucleic acid-binding protein
LIPYADSSAVLAWILGQKNGNEAHSAFSRSPTVFCSELTLFECERGLRSREGTGDLDAADAEYAQSLLSSVVQAWTPVPLSGDVLAFGRRSFPREPVRSLDAIHLGTALFLRERHLDLAVVTLDRRLAENAALLGFRVLPAEKTPPPG